MAEPTTPIPPVTPAPEPTPAAPVAPTAQPPPASTESLLDWRATLPDDLRGEKSLQDFKSVTDLARTTVHQQRMLGSSVQVPKVDGSPEDWGKFYDKLGRPKDAASYEYSAKDVLPEGVTLDKEFETRLREHAHASGWVPKQFQDAVGFVGNWLHESAQLQAAQAEQGRIDAVKAVQKRFGASTTRVRQEANAFFESLGNGLFGEPGEAKALADKVAASELALDPVFIGVFSEAFRRMGEGNLLESELPGGVMLQGRETLERNQREQLQLKMDKPRDWTPQQERQLQGIYEQLERLNSGRGRAA